MPQIYAVLQNGQQIPLSNRISTSFIQEALYVVVDRAERYPRNWHRYVHSLHTVPNWNSYSTLETLVKSLNDSRVSTVVLRPLQSLNSGHPMIVGVWDLQGFVLV